MDEKLARKQCNRDRTSPDEIKCRVRQFENADELTKEDIDMANCQVLGRSCKKRCRKQPRLLPPQKNCTVVDEEICREVTEEKCAEVDEEVCEDLEEELCDEQVRYSF